MKTITNYFLPMLIALGFLLVSCGDEKPNIDPVIDIVKDVVNTPNTQDTISKQKFVTWVNNWKADGVQFSTNTLPEFFTMPKVDLTEVLSDPKVKKTRFYLGLDTSHAVDSLHLVVVGVDKYGNDLLNYSQGQYAYDVTKLCPILCAGGQGYAPNPPN
ncbi:hypothetical protein N9B82_02420 [Saprospiraceae bacterium]|nr:hypothetical protein [Saprospiraceae bacterium]